MQTRPGTGTITAVVRPNAVENETQTAYQIVVMIGPLLTAHTTHQARLVMGRSDRADIQVIDASVSREHLVLCFGTKVTVEDLGSYNGTYAGGTRLRPRAPVELGPGHTISMGNASVLVRAIAADAPPANSPVRFPPVPDGSEGTHESKETLEVGPDVAWFRVAEADSVDLTRHPMLRRLFFTLVFHRLRSPGEPVPGDQLIEAVWPDKRSSREALRNRLYASLSRLRSLGLMTAIERSTAGYRLRPDLTIDHHV